MPPRPLLVIPTLALLSGCFPARFVWRDEPATIAEYRAAFAAAAGERFDATLDRAGLLAATRGARVLWLGDHHRSQRLHTLQRALLAELQRSGRPLVLVLEALGEQDDAAAAAFVAGAATDAELRAAVRARWPGSWLDDAALDAAHYRAVLAFAAAHALPVHGLEPTPRLPLAERDPRLAARVRALADARPAALLVVLVGQSHLLGAGDVVARCGLPSVALGGEPTPALRAAAATMRPPAPGAAWRSDGGLWWFAELCTAPPLPPPASDDDPAVDQRVSARAERAVSCPITSSAATR